MFKWLRGLSWAKIIGTDIPTQAPAKKKIKKVHRKRIRKSKK